MKIFLRTEEEFDLELAKAFEKWLQAERLLREAEEKAKGYRNTKKELEKKYPQIGNLKGMLKKKKEKKKKKARSTSPVPAPSNEIQIETTPTPTPEKVPTPPTIALVGPQPEVQKTPTRVTSTKPSSQKKRKEPLASDGKEKLDHLAKKAKSDEKTVAGVQFEKHLDM